MLNENEYKNILLGIGIKIGYYRRKAGMTQAELAEHTGLTLSYISQLESPNLPYCPSMKSLFSIAKALGIKASKIIDIDEN
ncbi:MAG: helix-turn-helix domain-containing protein [Firmicutes bacterium]|nr:helix-turn-helix domain-containing protein [Bacillota bacterium]